MNFFTRIFRVFSGPPRTLRANNPDKPVQEFPVETRRSPDPHEERVHSELRKTKELGVSGTHVNGGEITGYEPEPMFYYWRNWAHMVNRMTHNEAKLYGALNLLYNMLLSAKFKVLPASESAFDIELRDYVAKQLGLNGHAPRLKTSFEEQLRKFLAYLPVGARYLEEVYYYDEGKIWLKEWADREPTAHHSWQFDKDGEFTGVYQYAWNSPKKSAKPMPANKLVLFTIGRTGKNLRGIGLFRPVWPFYELKREILHALSVGAHRWAIPMPHLTVDRPGAIASETYTPKEFDQNVTSGQEMAASMAAGARSYVQDTPFVKLGVLGKGGAMDFSSPLEVVRYCDLAMLTGLVMQFMEMGFQQAGGNRSLGQVHELAFRRAAKNYIESIINVIMGVDAPGQGTMHRLLKFNFKNVKPENMPKLVFSGIGLYPLGESLSEIKSLIESGAIGPEYLASLQKRIADYLELMSDKGQK